MAAFDKLIQEIVSRYRLGPKASPLVQETLDVIAAQPGGVGGFLDRFKAAGFAAEVASWLGGTGAVPLSGDEVEQTLGSEVISEIANKAGISQTFARTILGYAIPSIIGLLAQGGAIPSARPAAASSFPGLAIPLSSSHADEITLPGAEQIPPGRTEEGGAAPPPARLLIPGASLLVTLGLLGYFVASGGAGNHVAPQSAPIVAQNAPAAIAHAPSTPARLAAAVSTPKSALSGKNPAGARNQPALNLPAIYFAANSAEVPSSGKPLLRQAAHLMKQLPAGTVVLISGYTHNSGDPTANTKLSQKRANAVRQVLVDAGVNPAMLSAKGYGSSNSLASKNGTMEGRSNSTMEDRPRNDRRVEFNIVQQ